MRGFIAKQPNGLYCRFSTVVDTVTHYNMTAADYIEYRKELAEKEAKDVLQNYLRPFERVLDSFIPENMSEEEFAEIVKKMSEGEGKISETSSSEECESMGEWFKDQQKRESAMRTAIKEVLLADKYGGKRFICCKHRGKLHELNTNVILLDCAMELIWRYEELMRESED